MVHPPGMHCNRVKQTFDGPIKSGANFEVRILIHELKKVRQAAGLTLAAVSKQTGMDQATLSRLENGRQPNPTVDTLWRYARAVGRQLVLTHSDAVAPERRNGKGARPARRWFPAGSSGGDVLNFEH